jgi:hypothetical protein
MKSIRSEPETDATSLERFMEASFAIADDITSKARSVGREGAEQYVATRIFEIIDGMHATAGAVAFGKFLSNYVRRRLTH